MKILYQKILGEEWKKFVYLDVACKRGTACRAVQANFDFEKLDNLQKNRNEFWLWQTL